MGVDGKPPQVLCGVLGLPIPAGHEVVLQLPDEILFLYVQVVAVWRDLERAHDRHAEGNMFGGSFLP